MRDKLNGPDWDLNPRPQTFNWEAQRFTPKIFPKMRQVHNYLFSINLKLT